MRRGAGLVQKLGASLRAFRMAWGGGRWLRDGAFYSGSGILPGSPLDYEQLAGDVLRNSVVSNCAMWIADNITEPNLGVQEQGWATGETSGIDVDHPLVQFLRKPNPHYDGDALWQATAISYAAYGNAYWIKVRGDGGTGATRELWWVPSWTLMPRWHGPNEFISYYEYRVDGQAIKLPVSDVVHFRYGIDPENPRLGMSRVRAVLREIVTDNEASTYWAAVLRNMGIWGCVISPAEKDGELPAGTSEVIRRQIAAQATGEERGKPLVLSHSVKVDQAALDPLKLMPMELRFIPEARICGAFRLPPRVVGLSAEDRTRSFSNYKQARRAAYEDCLMPMARRFAQTVESDLGPEWGLKPKERLVWEWREVAAMRDDLTAIYARVTVAVAGAWMKVNEGRAMAGLPPDPEGDVFRIGMRTPGAAAQVANPAVSDGPNAG